jgi:tetratricopeptide (TPR) repeat protein
MQVFGGWILTLPLGSYPMAHLIVGRDYLQAATVILIGFFLIAGPLFLIRASVFAKAERRSAVLVSVLVVFVLLLDAGIRLRCPAPDPGAIAFSRVFSKNPPAPEEQREIVNRLIREKHPNPIVYFYAVDPLKNYESLPDYLDTVRQMDRRLWAKWILALPEARTLSEDREEAGRLLERRPYSADELYWDEIARCLQEDDIHGARRGLKRALRYNPFSDFYLWRLSDVYAAQGDSGKAGECRGRLRRYLEARLNTYLRIRGRYARWESYLFREPFATSARELARFYEEQGERQRALMVLGLIAHHFPHEAAIGERIFRLKLQTGGESIDTKTLASGLDRPDTGVPLFGDAANLCIRRGELKDAISVLQTGFRHHPEADSLGYWLRKTLSQFTPDAIPFDDLLSASVDSPEYWVCVAENLNAAERFAEAGEIMEKVQAERPDHPWTNFVYGTALFHLGDLDRAEAAFRTAFRAAPDYPAYGVFLARTLSRQGQHEQALQILDEALEASADDSWLKEWKQRLEQEKSGGK